MPRGLGPIQKLILELLANEPQGIPQGMYFSIIREKLPISNKGRNFKHTVKKALLGLDARGLIERIPEKRSYLSTITYRYKLLKKPSSYNTTDSPGNTVKEEIERRLKVKTCLNCGAKFEVKEGTIEEKYVICEECARALLRK